MNDDGDLVVRTGKFFEVGEYPDRRFALTDEEADEAIETFEPAPLNVEHVPTIFDGLLGWVRRLWREGGDIVAEYAIPRWLHELTGGRPIRVSSEWDRRTKRPVGAALVLSPRVADAAVMAAFGLRSRREEGRMGLATRLVTFLRGEGVINEQEAATFARPPSEDRAEFAAMEAEIVRLRTDAARRERETQFGQDVGWIESHVAQMYVTPKAGSELRRVAEEHPAAFGMVKTAILANGPIASLAGDPRFSELRGASEDAARFSVGARDDQTLAELAERRARRDGIGYAQALLAVAKENPELAR